MFKVENRLVAIAKLFRPFEPQQIVVVTHHPGIRPCFLQDTDIQLTIDGDIGLCMGDARQKANSNGNNRLFHKPKKILLKKRDFIKN